MTASLPDSHTLPATVLVTELHHSMGHYWPAQVLSIFNNDGVRMHTHTAPGQQA